MRLCALAPHFVHNLIHSHAGCGLGAMHIKYLNLNRTGGRRRHLLQTVLNQRQWRHSQQLAFLCRLAPRLPPATTPYPSAPCLHCCLAIYKPVPSAGRAAAQRCGGYKSRRLRACLRSCSAAKAHPRQAYWVFYSPSPGSAARSGGCISLCTALAVWPARWRRCLFWRSALCSASITALRLLFISTYRSNTLSNLPQLLVFL